MEIEKVFYSLAEVLDSQQDAINLSFALLALIEGNEKWDDGYQEKRKIIGRVRSCFHDENIVTKSLYQDYVAKKSTKESDVPMDKAPGIKCDSLDSVEDRIASLVTIFCGAEEKSEDDVQVRIVRYKEGSPRKKIYVVEIGEPENEDDWTTYYSVAGSSLLRAVMLLEERILRVISEKKSTLKDKLEKLTEFESVLSAYI